MQKHEPSKEGEIRCSKSKHQHNINIQLNLHIQPNLLDEVKENCEAPSSLASLVHAYRTWSTSVTKKRLHSVFQMPILIERIGISIFLLFK